MLYPPEVKLEDAPCPLGCASRDEVILTGHDRLYGVPGEFRVVRCLGCGLLRTNPRPTQETIGLYYPDNYGPHRFHVSLNRRSDGLRFYLGRLARWVFRFNHDCLPPLRPGRLLEVGCATGAFLGRMALKNWEVEGVESSPDAAEAARLLGYPVHAGPMESAPEPDRAYDLVVGWMVLEHFHNPLLALQKIHAWTKPGGWLVLSVPDAGSLEFRFFKSNWYALHLPNHLFHFTRRTLAVVLERSGWQLRRVLHQRRLSNLIGSLGHLLQEKGHFSFLAKSLVQFPEGGGKEHYMLYPLAWLLATIGQTGRMTVWARRIS